MHMSEVYLISIHGKLCGLCLVKSVETEGEDKVW